MEHLKSFGLFLAFSAVLALIAWALDVYDYSPDEEPHTEVIYHNPGGDRRF